VAFVVPSDWAVLTVQSFPPVSVAAFQAPNAADQGGPDSTNAAVSIFHLQSDQARSARSTVGKAFGPTAPSVGKHGEWTIYSQEASQGSTTYTVLDGVREFPELNVAVAVRLAWPHLRNNPAGYDAGMKSQYDKLLDSISSQPGSYSPAKDEVVRRPSR
jgi:hypothetical protein